jgi:recombination protein RecA
VAVSIKKTVKNTTSAAALLQAFQKEHGDSIGSFGGNLVDSDRVPTGMFPLDLALGGGFPRGKCSIIFGPESSGKTNLALLAIAQHQLLWPDKTCIFFDVEGSFDPVWARALGVNTDKLIVIRPSYAEQLVDMAESVLYTEDCGIVVIDSLAALVTTQELESSAEKANVGGTGLVTGKLVRKTTLALSEAEKAGRKPTLIYINQIRHKIGVMYGNPETQPGGNAPQFQAAIRLRVYGKNEMDSKVSSVMPIKKVTTFAISKWKAPILAASGKFEMVTLAHKGMPVGFCDDFNTVSEYLKTFGMFDKGEKGKGWVILGDDYPTIQPFKDKLYGDKKFGADVRAAIIERLLKEGGLLEGGDDAE